MLSHTFVYNKSRVSVHESSGRLERCIDGGAHEKVTRTQLARDYPNACSLWEWLKSRGISRPRSGPRGRRPTREEREARGETQISAWLSESGVRALDELCDLWDVRQGETIGKACEIALEIEKKKKG